MGRRIYRLHDAQGWYRALPDNYIFVFGSNTRGIHGAGAALAARLYFAALQGCGEGYYGRSYAVPTKDHELQPRSLQEVAASVERFLEFARLYRRQTFVVTELGTGRAKFEAAEIAELFLHSPLNCLLPIEWKRFLPEDAGFVVDPINSNWRYGDPHPITNQRKPNEPSYPSSARDRRYPQRQR